MSATKIDLGRPSSGAGPPGPAEADPRGRKSREKRRKPLRTLPFRLLRAVVAAVLLAIAPFFLLIRGGVFAYQEWGWESWPALLASAGATVLLMTAYGWLAGRRAGAGRRLRGAMIRLPAFVVLAYVVYALVHVGSANTKSPEVRSEYQQLHPLLRLAASVVILADPASVITDAGRTPDFYRRMGLPPNEASLHFPQANGFVHALDLRTNGRPEWRNRIVELGFWALGFHSLRHVGTADHLHVSLRMP